MSTLRRSTRTIAATIAAFAVVVGLAIGGPAHATEVAPPPVDDSSIGSWAGESCEAGRVVGDG